MPEGVRARTRGRVALAAALAAVLVLGATGSVGRVAAADGGPNRRGLSGWVPYWEPTDGRNAFTANSALFEELSPFWHSAFGEPGTIVLKASSTTLDTVVSAGRARGVPVVPTITDGTGKGVMAVWLGTQTTRAQHIGAIVNLVVVNGYDGIDIDYEGFAFNDGTASWEATRPNWVTFVRELGATLHARGKRLIVTVPPIYFYGGKLRGYTVYDWAGIIGSVDRLRIMTYDWSVGRAGPISPSYYVDGTIDYARSIGIPMTKVQIGIPLYGRDWVTKQQGTCPAPSRRSVTNAAMGALIAEYGAALTRDPTSGEVTFTYTETTEGSGAPVPTTPVVPDPNQAPIGAVGPAVATQGAVRLGVCTQTHTVWFLDEEAIADRASWATSAGAGVALWALGYDAPWSWSALGRVLAPQR